VALHKCGEPVMVLLRRHELQRTSTQTQRAHILFACDHIYIHSLYLYTLFHIHQH
jgi:hypothetical protein